MIEMEPSKLRKLEVIKLVANYSDLELKEIKQVIDLLIKMGIISEYIFQDTK